MRLYVNGALAGTVAATGNMANSALPLRIGGNAIWGEYFAGRIDEVRIFNRALSAAEVTDDDEHAGGGRVQRPADAVELDHRGFGRPPRLGGQSGQRHRHGAERGHARGADRNRGRQAADERRASMRRTSCGSPAGTTTPCGC